MTGILISELSAGILRLTLNDAATRNSLSEAMIGALQDAFDSAANDKAVRVIVVAGHGAVYSSGHNLKEISLRRADPDKGAAYFKKLFATCASLMMAIVNSPKPVIAEVAGLASAAGCQLVASCDLAIASEQARFCTPGVNIGLFCSTPMVALSRNVVPKHAMEMLLSGDIINAQEAARIGLVNRVVAPEQLAASVDALAAKIASKSLVTVRTGKKAFYQQLGLPLEEAYALTAKVMADNLLQRDAEEGIGAFLDKRHPKWSDES